jgi:O-antigen ligase
VQKLLKESYIYRIFSIINIYLNKLVANSYFIKLFTKDKETNKDTIFTKIFNSCIIFLRKIALKLKLDKAFENSIFVKTHLWVGLVIAASPFLPTMLVLATVLISILSLILKASTDTSFKFKFFKSNIWILAFVFIIGFCAVTSISMAESIKIALLTIAFILFYFVFINVITSKKQLYTMLYLFIIAGTIASIYGIYQYMVGDLYSQAWLDKEMFEDIKMRVYSTFANPNVFGEYLLLVIPIGVSLFWTEKGIIKKLFLLGSVGITLIALILTISRGCWLGILFSLMILALIIDRRLIFVGIAMLLIAPFVLPESILERFMSIGNMGDTSTSYRVFIWMGTIAMLKDYWFSGIGLGISSFNSVYPIYAFNGISAPHSHNLYLQMIVEYGLVGLIVFVGVIYYFYKTIVISLIKKKNIVLAGILCGVSGFLLQSLTDHSWYNYRVLLIFWIVYAIGISMSEINNNVKEGNKNG